MALKLIAPKKGESKEQYIERCISTGFTHEKAERFWDVWHEPISCVHASKIFVQDKKYLN